jgi:metal-dependent amidase/aminoacylase/carboxypeptidase family protein
LPTWNRRWLRRCLEGNAGMNLIDGRVADAAAIGSLRRDIHAHPELRFEELRTAALVTRKLAEWGIPMHQGMAQTGIIGIAHGSDGGAYLAKTPAPSACAPTWTR